MKQKLIEFLEFTCETGLCKKLQNLTYDTIVNEYLNSINEASNESLSVRENVGGEIKCHSKQKYFEDCEAHNKIYCEGCKYFY